MIPRKFVLIMSICYFSSSVVNFQRMENSCLQYWKLNVFKSIIYMMPWWNFLLKKTQ